MISGRTYRWSTADGLVPCELPDVALLVADSWLVDGGTVRGLERHRRRFTASCAQVPGLTAAGLTAAILDAFWAAACAGWPGPGGWSPGWSRPAGRPRRRLCLRTRPRRRRRPPPGSGFTTD